MNDSPDIVVLHTPRGGGALPVMRVIMGGVACRNGLQLDRLDDLELAVETLLAEELPDGDAFTLTVSCDDSALTVLVEGLTNQALRAVLSAPDPFQPSPVCRLDVRLFLDALVDRYQLVEGSGLAFAVEMEKRAC